MAGWTTGTANFNAVAFINIGSKSDTRLQCIEAQEFVLNTNGKSDIDEWRLVSSTHIPINTAVNEWKINITTKTGDVNMPVEMAGNDLFSGLRMNFAFNVSRQKGTGPLTSRPTIVGIPIAERLVSNNQWRIPWQSTGDYEISGVITDPATVLIIDEGSWEVVKAEQVVAGAYTVTGLQNRKTLVVATKTNGESLAQGGIDPDQS